MGSNNKAGGSIQKTEAEALKKERLLSTGNSNKIAILSFIASLCVVVYHSRQSLDGVPSANTALSVAGNQIVDYATGLSLCFFFMMSAFLLYRDLSFKNLKSKIKTRVKTLLVPFLLWNGIMYLLTESYMTGTDRLYLNIVLSKYAGTLWFVGALLLLLTVSPVCLIVFKNRFVALGLVACTLALEFFNWFGIADYFPDGAEAGRFLGYLPSYVIGICLGMHGFCRINEERYGRIGRGVACVLLIACFLIPIPALRRILPHIEVPLIWMALPARMFRRAPRWWQQITFYTFACHQVFCYQYIAPLLSLLLGFVAVPVERFFCRLFVAAVTFAFVLLTAWILMRLAPKAYTLLTGGRVPKDMPAGRNRAVGTVHTPE